MKPCELSRRDVIHELNLFGSELNRECNLSQQIHECCQKLPEKFVFRQN